MKMKENSVMKGLQEVVNNIFSKEKNVSTLFLLFDANNDHIPVPENIMEVLLQMFNNRRLFSLAVSKLAQVCCARYIVFVSEAWFVMRENMTGLDGLRPSESDDRVECAIISVTDLFEKESFGSLAKMIRDGDEVKLGEWEEMNGSMGGALHDGFIEAYQMVLINNLDEPEDWIGIDKTKVPIIE
jgi:hypothetical protein